ncbi:MAG: helix-turn-helix domain-containing protein [Pseudomonadales bacterium]|nr:helix-turn-helix domain-containing protein [Pseudomonadales bacterium]
MNDILAVEEVAEYLKCHKDSVYKKAKELGGRKVGRRIIFHRSSLDHYLIYGYAPGCSLMASHKEDTLCTKSGNEKIVPIGKLTSKLKASPEYEEALALPSKQKRKSWRDR